MSIPFDDMNNIFNLSLEDAKAAVSTLDKEALADFAKQVSTDGIKRLFDFLGMITEKYHIFYTVEVNINVVEKFG